MWKLGVSVRQIFCSFITMLMSRTRLTQGSVGGHLLLLDCGWTTALCSSEVSVSPLAQNGRVDPNGSLRIAIESRGRPTDMREWSEVSQTPSPI